MTEVLNTELLIFLAGFTLIAAALLFISVKRLYIKKPVLVILIPLLIWGCLFVYSSYESKLGYPTVNQEELFSRKFVVLWALPVEDNKIYVTVQRQGDTLLKLYLLEDPNGEISKAMQQARGQNGQNQGQPAEGNMIPLSYDPAEQGEDDGIRFKLIDLERLMPKS